MTNRLDLIVQVSSDAATDREELTVLARHLGVELLEADVETAEPLTENNAPEGAKGLSTVAGALSIRLGATGLKAVVAKIVDWAFRNGRTVEVTIDGDKLKVTNASRQQQEIVINLWLSRHAPGA
jgi:hypothetical protein